MSTVHPFRLALGSFFVNRLGDPRTASVLLHHVDTTMVIKTYSAKDKFVDAGAAYDAAQEMIEDEPGEADVSAERRIAELEAANARLMATLSDVKTPNAA